MIEEFNFHPTETIQYKNIYILSELEHKRRELQLIPYMSFVCNKNRIEKDYNLRKEISILEFELSLVNKRSILKDLVN